MKIDKDKCIQIILEKNPGFIEEWQEHLDFWGTEKNRGLCNDLGAFSHYVEGLLQRKDSIDLKKIFDLMEWFLVEGTDEVKNAVATCFLENLINYCAHGSISSVSFVHFLGKKSREYCKAWDKFCGAKTEGLWP